MKLETKDKATNEISTKVTCYVALGSNMGDSQAYVKQAIKDLDSHSQISDLSISHFYKSKPHGPQDQPDYLNAAAELKTDLEAEALLEEYNKKYSTLARYKVQLHLPWKTTIHTRSQAPRLRFCQIYIYETESLESPSTEDRATWIRNNYMIG